MSDEENVKSARLSSDEADFLDKNNISFTDLVRDALDKKQKETKIGSKKKTVNKVIANGVYAIIGLALLSVLNVSSGNLFTIAIIGGLGAFFLLIGGINLYLTIKEADIYRIKK